MSATMLYVELIGAIARYVQGTSTLRCYSYYYAERNVERNVAPAVHRPFS